jgi:cytoskeletal protein CcmA (bactofilin family)
MVLGEIESSSSPFQATQAERMTCFVGSGSDLSGEIAFKGVMHLDGTFSGLVTSDDGTLVVGASGEVDASIEVATAQIHGTVKGDISAKELVVLKPTAIVMGDIETPSLRIEDGAVFEGRCRMSGGPSAAQAVRRKLRRLGLQR